MNTPSHLPVSKERLVTEEELTLLAAAFASELDWPDASASGGAITKSSAQPLATTPLTVFLRGDLGAGKTTFVRALLRELGVHGRVKSPSYSLVESYRSDKGTVQHFDFYRVLSIDELEFIALRELLDEAVLVLVEWPDIAMPELPNPDWSIHLQYRDEQRAVSFEPG